MPAGTVSTPKTALGARLRELRLGQEWSQRDLAELLNTKTNRISDWEIGKHEPTLPLLQRIAAVYDLTVAQLLKGVM
jgi:putative transcriptional regulator